MKKLFSGFAIAGTIILASSCGRDNVGPIYDYRTFVDEFSDDRNGWSFADQANLAYGVVDNGTFQFDYNDDLSPAYYVSKDVGLNPNNDFTIQTRIGSNNNMGLLFGYSGSTGAYGYSFTVDANGYYAFYDEGGNGYGPDIQTIIPPTTNSFINGNGQFNDLKLEQRGNRWIGYINNYQVFNIERQNMNGYNVGFVDVSNTQGEADYLQVDWID